MNKAPFGARMITVIHRGFLAIFYLVLRSTIGLYCRVRFRPRYSRPSEVRKLHTPFIVLADHVHPMDMFIIGLGLRPVIHWVAADANFRTPFMKFVMTVLAGAVAKAKNRSDMVTLSRLKLLTDMGSVVGVYQEGERSWDGVSLPPMKGTDKLVRFLKAPVVYAHLEGAYLEHPRWTWSGNRTPIRVRYELLIRPDEAGSLPLSEIGRRIESTGQYDEWAFQARTRQLLRGRKRAENVELVCFLCPSCRSVNSLKSEDNHFTCSHCGLAGQVDEYGFFQWDSPERTSWPVAKPFSTVRDWNLWQTDFYHGELERLFGVFGDGVAAVSEPSEHLFWEDREVVRLSRGRRGRQMKELGVGSARFYGDRIELECPGFFLAMALEDISSFSTFKQFYTEFYYERELYQLSFTSHSVSGYKWLMLFRLILDVRSEG